MSLTIKGVDHLLGLFSNSTHQLDGYWIALTTNEVSVTDSGAEIMEPVGGGYRRAYLYNVSGSWNIVGGTLSSDVEITFPTATDTWGEIIGWAVCTESSEGEVLMSGDVDVPFTVETGSIVVIPPGGISIELEIDRWVL